MAAVVNALFLAAAVYVYLALARQIAARAPSIGALEPTFGWPDAIAAFGLATLFALNAAAPSASNDRVILGTRDLVANALISLSLLVFVAAFLTLRGRRVTSLAGFSKLSFRRSLTTASVLLLVAYPLLAVAELITQQILRGPSSRQGIVELFNGSQTLKQRIIIIVLAVAIAPMVEEFIFRFYLYGVIKRYFGRFAGLLANSLLFAAVHAHVPSALPLFVLGVCLTLAYEWSGSIVVSMTMHALFNSLTLTALAFPDLLPQ